MFLFIAASVVTLHCQTYDISTGSRGAPRSFTATIDYGREYAFLRGEIFGDGLGVGNVDVTPGSISVPRAGLGETGTLRGARFSRGTGEVRVITYDIQTAIDDAVANNGLSGERSYVGACQPGALVPIPATRF